MNGWNILLIFSMGIAFGWISHVWYILVTDYVKEKKVKKSEC